MPVADDLDTPIRYVKITGPAVDALQNRKEDNNNPRVSAAILRRTFHSVKDGIVAGLASLVAATDDRIR